jgi:hypothetical protein
MHEAAVGHAALSNSPFHCKDVGFNFLLETLSMWYDRSWSLVGLGAMRMIKIKSG